MTPTPVTSTPALQQLGATSLPVDLITALLAGAILLACVFSLALLFGYIVRIRSYGLHRDLLFDAVYKRQIQLQSNPILRAEEEKRKVEEDIKRLERSLESEEVDVSRQALRRQVEQKNKELEEAEKRVTQITEQIEEEAKRFSKAAIPPISNWEYGPSFYIEFGTVLVIIFAVLMLAVLGALRAEHTSTILAAIAGYVLGKASRQTYLPSQQQQQNRNDQEQP